MSATPLPAPRVVGEQSLPIVAYSGADFNETGWIFCPGCWGVDDASVGVLAKVHYHAGGLGNLFSRLLCSFCGERLK